MTMGKQQTSIQEEMNGKGCGTTIFQALCGSSSKGCRPQVSLEFRIVLESSNVSLGDIGELPKGRFCEII
jgi:hypothetical protein